MPETPAEKRGGIKIHFGEPDPDRVVVSMLEYQGHIYVATQKGIYRMEGDEMKRLEFVEKEPDSS